jgi:hypothetical protein
LARLSVISKGKTILVGINITHLLLGLKKGALSVANIIISINKYFK